MAFLKTTVDKLPKRTRTRTPRFEKTSEWWQLKAALDTGLKPNEALAVTFTEAEMQKYQIRNRRTVARHIQKYVAAHKLPYKVQGFKATNGFFVQVKRVSDKVRQ
jgi:hypothetical protein